MQCWMLASLDAFVPNIFIQDPSKFPAKRPRIAFLNTYFGQYKAFASRCFQSAAANARTADFYFFISSITQPGPAERAVRTGGRQATNIFVQRYGDLTELAAFFSSRLGFQIQIKTGRTLGDFTPTLGYIFEPWLSAYSHWAWLDIDQIFGDIGAMLSPSDWAMSVVSFRPGAQDTHFSGPLTIVRNQPQLNKVIAIGHPLAPQLLSGEDIMGGVAHYDEWQSVFVAHTRTFDGSQHGHRP